MIEQRPTPRFFSKGTPFPGVLFFFAFLVASSSLPADPPALKLYAFEEPHMGTLFRIKLYAPSERQAREAATAAFRRIDQINSALSDYLPRSEINQLVKLPPGKTTKVGEDLRQILRHSLSIHELSDGAFDPTLGHFTNLWRRSVRKGRLPTSGQIADARARTGLEKLHIQGSQDRTTVGPAIEGMLLDFGGIAKGYAADQALAALEKHGVTRAAIAAGGDIRIGDPPPDSPSGWDIPVLGMDRDHESIAAALKLKNAAVSTSGDREQFVEIDGRQYSHIVDPRTGLGLTHRVTATVIAPDATTSDALATTLCILGPNHGVALPPRIHYLIVTRNAEGDDREHRSPGFPKR